MSINCNEIYEPQSPLYLYVRRDKFLHAGIGNAADPYDYDAIAEDIIVGVNDVVPPYAKIINETVPVDVTFYDCGPTTPQPASAILIRSTCIATGTFTAIVYSPASPKAFAEGEEFVGLEQIVAYNKVDAVLPDPANYDIDIDLEGGGVDHPNYIGFKSLTFTPDSALDPNGPGAYLFAIWPKARIKDTTDPS